MYKVGDYVTRKKYNNDVLFRIEKIEDNKIILSGVDLRLYVESNEDDLVLTTISKKKENYDLIRKLDTSNYIYLPGTILHIDSDKNYLDKCFEFDFNRCQFYKEFKDDNLLMNLKTYLREHYRNIIDCYKYYSSIGGYSVWQITQNSLSEFIYKCPGLCDKSYDINNIYLQQKVVVGNLVLLANFLNTISLS